jgi:hypothetical protein
MFRWGEGKADENKGNVCKERKAVRGGGLNGFEGGGGGGAEWGGRGHESLCLRSPPLCIQICTLSIFIGLPKIRHSKTKRGKLLNRPSSMPTFVENRESFNQMLSLFQLFWPRSTNAWSPLCPHTSHHTLLFDRSLTLKGSAFTCSPC